MAVLLGRGAAIEARGEVRYATQSVYDALRVKRCTAVWPIHGHTHTRLKHTQSCSQLTTVPSSPTRAFCSTGRLRCTRLLASATRKPLRYCWIAAPPWKPRTRYVPLPAAYEPRWLVKRQPGALFTASLVALSFSPLQRGNTPGMLAQRFNQHAVVAFLKSRGAKGLG